MKKPTLNNQFVLKKIEGGSAYLSGEGEALVPKNFLPKDAKVGDQFVITVADPKSEAEKSQVTAREILNEILKPKKIR